MTIGEDYDGSDLILIVGCPRSGTTWIQQLLASHPLVRSGPESDLFDLYIGPQVRTWQRELTSDSSGRRVGLANHMTEEDFILRLRRYCIDLLDRMMEGTPPEGVFVEKTPSHAIFMDEIDRLLPATRFIHILRDPRDVVASLLAAAKGWGREWAPSSVPSAARMWLEHVRAVRASSLRLGSDRFLEVRYEDLHADPSSVMSEVWRYIGLIPPETTTEPAELKRRGELADVPSDEPADFYRKGRPGAWRTDLNPAQRFLLRRVLGRYPTELGYR